jgi:hypothetical protein
MRTLEDQMEARILTRSRLLVAGCLLLLFQLACSNPFAPPTTKPPPGVEKPPAEKATTPEIALDNLERAFEDRDKVLYETLLDERFWFTEDDCAGNLIFQNGREEEIAIMGPRDGSSEGILDQFRTIEFDFQAIERRTELGRDFPNAFDGDPDGHPDENWEVFRGRVIILLLVESNDGLIVDQTMNYKLREGDDGLWRMARWIDDPLAGDCAGEETGKVATAAPGQPATWSQLKQR